MVTSERDLSIEVDFPAVASEGYKPTSDATPDYNCIAWANGLDSITMWPTPNDIPGNYWPDGAPLDPSVDSFVQAFQMEGWEDAGVDQSFWAGYETVAIYAKGSEVTHMARQLPDGTWTSKLGPNKDIQHFTLSALANSKSGESVYGEVVRFLRRKAGDEPISSGQGTSSVAQSASDSADDSPSESGPA
jgi:hypothetical protein